MQTAMHNISSQVKFASSLLQDCTCRCSYVIQRPVITNGGTNSQTNYYDEDVYREKGKIPLSCFNKRKQIFLDADGGPSIGHSQQSPPSHYFWNWGQRSPKNERFYISSLNNAICGIMLISMFTNHLAIFRTRTNFEYGRSDFLYQTILNLLSNNF
ncbi:hypothetical protein GQX74_009465 [Glossina fuscipes]|nr:hypothetical protein GQX74_009465 [Glossina fuscipes]